MKDVIKKQQQYSQTINEVWSAITEQEKISKWFMKCNFKAETGYRYSLISTDDNCEKVAGTIMTVNPVHELVYSWEVAGMDTNTTVTWTLEEKDGGTLLTLVHSGISNYPTEETAIKMFESFNGGWDNCISSLGKYLAEANVETANG